MSDIIFTCSGCGQKLSVGESAGGARVSCPTCEAVVTIPLAPSPTPTTSLPEGWSGDRDTSEANAWRSGDTIIVRRGARPSDQHCVGCGAVCETFQKLKLDWLEPWKVVLIVLFSGLVLGPLVFMALSKKATIELPTCEKCTKSKRLLKRLIVWFIVGGFAVIAVGIVANGLLHMETLSQVLGLSGLAGSIVGIGLALWWKAGLKTTKIDGTSVWLQIRGSRYASRLPHWRG